MIYFHRGVIIINFKEVKQEISYIAKIENAKECQKELRTLNQILNERPHIKKINRGSYYDI